MIIFKKADALNGFLRKQKVRNKTIGFVPTMGALHSGHLSLIRESNQQNDITVCSIFINPTQFNDKEDYKAYPVMIENDIEELQSSECNILFLPSVEEVYIKEYAIRDYQLGKLQHILEGQYRPSHFQGVCQVVERLLNVVEPDVLYMGQKDYQQCLIIKKLLDILGKESVILLRICPTEREPDGLAMSSRNLRLDETQRKIAPYIFQTLLFIKQNITHWTFDQLKEKAKYLLETKGFKVDYVEIADAETLEPVVNDERKMIALIAAGLKKIRLIDNLMLN